jgi:hypothetical protein
MFSASIDDELPKEQQEQQEQQQSDELPKEQQEQQGQQQSDELPKEPASQRLSIAFLPWMVVTGMARMCPVVTQKLALTMGERVRGEEFVGCRRKARPLKLVPRVVQASLYF